MIRPDQENLDTLLAHFKQVSFGRTKIEVTLHDGMIAGWEEITTRRGHRAPLQKIEESKEDD